MSTTRSNRPRTGRKMAADRQRALDAARHPMESKFGGAMLRTTGQETRMLTNKVGRLERELKRQQMRIEQAKKHFIFQHQLPEPTLIVVRPPSPEIIKKAIYRTKEEDEETAVFQINKRGYLKALKRNTHVPSLRTTIDAFTMKTSKKRNVWEFDDAKPIFQTKVQPSWPLTEHEQAQLRMAWESHVRPVNSLSSLEKNKNLPSSVRRKRHSKRTPVDQPESEEDSEVTFITELPEYRAKGNTGVSAEICSPEPSQDQASTVDSAKKHWITIPTKQVDGDKTLDSNTGAKKSVSFLSTLAGDDDDDDETEVDRQENNSPRGTKNHHNQKTGVTHNLEAIRQIIKY